MSKTNVSKKAPAPRTAHKPVTQQDVWLASLGAVSLARKQLVAGIDQSFYMLQRLRGQAEDRFEQGAQTIEQTAQRARELADDYSDKLQTGLTKARTRAEAAIGDAREQAEALLKRAQAQMNPVLVKMGLGKPAPKRRTPARKPAVRSKARSRVARAA